MRKGWGNSKGLVLLGCLAWAGNAAYALGVNGGVTKTYSPAVVALALAVFFVWHCGHRYGRSAILRFVAVVFVVGWAFETLSVMTGVPFGRYHYTDIMSPFLGHVPVFVLPAYLFMGYASWSMATLMLGIRTAALPRNAAYKVPLVAAGLMVLWDLSMDPLRATVEGRWIWIDGGAYLGVPVSNYVGWFLVTWCMFQGFAILLKDNPPSERSDIVADRSYWAAIPLIYSCFAGEYLLNPFVDHDPALTATGTGVQNIFSSVALITSLTLVPVLLLGLILALRPPLSRTRIHSPKSKKRRPNGRTSDEKPGDRIWEASGSSNAALSEHSDSAEDACERMETT